MFKRMGTIVLVGVFFFTFIGLTMAGGKGNARKGKYLYRKNCRTCHIENGTAKELSPISKTQAQWKEVFAKSDQLECKDKWAKLSAKDRRDIYAHLWGHAYDSPSPAKCE